MKKTLIIATMAALTAVSSYGQGWLNFQGFLHNTANNYTTPGTVTYNAGINVELFFATAGKASAVSAIAASSSPATLTYTTKTAWADIMGDSLFQAVQGTGGAGTVAQFASAANGGGVYNASKAYGAGNLVGGTTYSMYEVAWFAGTAGQYTTLALAAAANGNNGTYVGWSQVFSYNALTSGNPAPTLFANTFVGLFDVGGTIPEPTTMALAGLGGLAMLMFRRRK
jgi:hypothetical protein